MLPPLFTPDFLSRLESLRLHTRKEALGNLQGSHPSPRRGTSLEFADYRRYSPGDDIRYLDWGLFARSDRLYVKLFREEVDLYVYLFVDASGSMAFPSTERKFGPACDLAMALAYVVLANHDRVKLHWLQDSQPLQASPFYQGRHRIKECATFLSTVIPDGPLDLARCVARHLAHLHRPGKAVLISDFLMPLSSFQRGLNLLRSVNLDISVIQVLSTEESNPPFPTGNMTVVEAETGAELRLDWNRNVLREYRQRLENHSRQLRGFCHQAGIDFSLYSTDLEVREFILRTLPSTGLFR